MKSRTGDIRHTYSSFLRFTYHIFSHSISRRAFPRPHTNKPALVWISRSERDLGESVKIGSVRFRDFAATRLACRTTSYGANLFAESWLRCPALLLLYPIKFNCTLYTEFAIAALYLSHGRRTTWKSSSEEFLSAIPRLPITCPTPTQPSLPFFLSILFLLLSFCSYCDNHLHKESRNYGRQLPQTVYPDPTPGLRWAGSVRGLCLRPELFMRYCAFILE